MTYDDSQATLLDAAAAVAGQGMMAQSHLGAPGQLSLALATVYPLREPTELYHLTFTGQPASAQVQIAMAQPDEGRMPLRLVPVPDAGSVIYLPLLTR